MESDPSTKTVNHINPIAKHIVEKKRPTWKTNIWILFTLLILTSLEYYFFQKNSPASVINNLVVLVIFNIILILLVVLIVLITRTLLQLYNERKSDTLGSKFQTKLIIAFLILTLVPSVLLFTVASKLFTYSIDSWFNIKIEQTLQQSMDIAQEYYAHIEKNAFFDAQKIEHLINTKELFRRIKRDKLNILIKQKKKEYELGGIILYDNNYKEIVSEFKNNNVPYTEINNFKDLLKKSISGEGVSDFRTSSQGNYLAIAMPLTEAINKKVNIWGYILTLTPIPASTQHKIQSIQNSFESYKRQKFLQLPVSASYYTTFVIITLLILFSAIWLGFYMARSITIPIQQLAEGTRRISEGNLNFKLEVDAKDEIGYLVDSFNRMTKELNDNQTKIQSANQNLKATNIKLERRRQYIATILEHIGAGVLSINKAGHITTFNKAAEKILNSKAVEVLGSNYKDAFDPGHQGQIRKIIRDMASQNNELAEKQIELRVNETPLTLLTNIQVLRDTEKKYLGLVIVFEDLTTMVKTQKIAAWKEVAQGIAHEIKNPLTPILLNTERLRKKYHEDKESFGKVFEESINIISQEVEGMKNLINEFLRFARMPSPLPKLNSLHKIIDDITTLYNNNDNNLTIKKRYDPNINNINVDAEQLRRVFINLFENSLDALNKSGVIEIKTTLDLINNKVKILFSDNGIGISSNDRDKLFLPHFTTKKRGSGLGLAIVNRIIVDHNGSINLQEHESNGTTFEIKLPYSPVSFKTNLVSPTSQKKNSLIF
jgi:two-component system, NtrC family, nitrogen regulation sensor histidine kinase NtrY